MGKKYNVWFIMNEGIGGVKAFYNRKTTSNAKQRVVTTLK